MKHNTKIEINEESLSSTVGPTEIKQTASGFSIINHGDKPITVRMSVQDDLSK